MDKNKILKPLLLLVVLIIFCSVLTRIFSNSETLADYAAKNPEIAYSDTKTETEKEKNKNIEPETSPQKQTIDGQFAETQNSTNESVNPNDQSDTNNITTNTDTTTQESEASTMTNHPDRVVYKDGFYYEPLSEDLKRRITGISYPVTEAEKDTTLVKAINIVPSAEDIQVTYDDLCYVSVLHYNFKGIERTGELICNKAIAQDLVEIFYELYQNEYQIEQIRLVDEYSGDDTLSMMDNNTSCFNYRVVDGTSNLSKHAMGLAIDINPFFNPYVVYKNDGTTYISPQGSETYADRSKDFAYKIDENDLCYKLFKEHGFIWGGDWNSCKDYQHFQKVPE